MTFSMSLPVVLSKIMGQKDLGCCMTPYLAWG